jgi:hypothetical protein
VVARWLRRCCIALGLPFEQVTVLVRRHCFGSRSMVHPITISSFVPKYLCENASQLLDATGKQKSLC